MAVRPLLKMRLNKNFNFFSETGSSYQFIYTLYDQELNCSKFKVLELVPILVHMSGKVCPVDNKEYFLRGVH